MSLCQLVEMFQVKSTSWSLDNRLECDSTLFESNQLIFSKVFNRFNSWLLGFRKHRFDTTIDNNSATVIYDATHDSRHICGICFNSTHDSSEKNQILNRLLIQLRVVSRSVSFWSLHGCVCWHDVSKIDWRLIPLKNNSWSLTREISQFNSQLDFSLRTDSILLMT